MRVVALLLLCACASSRMLPLPSSAGSSQAMPVRYEKTRFFFFRSIEGDGLLERFFAGGPTVLATVAAPQTGVFASPDEGRSWTFAPLDGPALREVLFDSRDPQRIYARSGPRILRSTDSGRTWSASVPGGETLDALALGAAGAVLAAGHGRLFISADGAQTWRPLSLQGLTKPWRARSIVADPAHPGAIYLSIHIEEEQPRDLLARFTALLDYTSEEAVSALKLADARDEKPRTIAWGGASGDGLYLSQDGGALWKKTGLALDAWVAWRDGALYAVAADPILAAAALMRRYPDLAALADRQMRGAPVDPAGLRAACRFPGREKLFEGPLEAALVLRSQDGGATWARVADLPLPLGLALREAVERASWEALPYRSPPRPRQPQQRLPRGQPPSRYVGVENPQRSGVPRVFQGAVAGETLLAFVDPMRLLAHFNGGLALSGISGGAGYAATEAWWAALTEAMASASESDGEISLGPGTPQWKGGAAFELLRSADGASWQPQDFQLPQKSPDIVPFPGSIAATPGQLFLVLGGRDKSGQMWRTGFRAGAP